MTQLSSSRIFIFCNVAIATFVVINSVPAFAATPRVNLQLNVSSGKSIRTVVTSSNLPPSGCRYALNGSTSSATLSRDFDSSTRLFEIPATASKISASATLPQLKRSSSRNQSTTIYFRAVLKCGSKKYYSSIRANVIKTSSRGESSVSNLLRKSGKNLKAILTNTVPTPTPTPAVITPTPEPTPPLPTLALNQAFPQLSFTEPLFLTNANDGSNRIFIVEKGGKIFSFDNNAGTTQKTEFLNISSKIATDSERGLLGLAFSPGYPTVPYLYVYYTRVSDGTLVLARYTKSSDGTVADANSEKILFTVPHPQGNHNGGCLAFGSDGKLYVGLGDGGGGGDPSHNGQNLGTFLGKILRLEVLNIAPETGYVVPTDNPFVNTRGAKPEIFAYGFRNPWRFSFDIVTKALWVGDVGQDAVEEVDVVHSGGNYGWNTMEGSACYPSTTTCNKTGLLLPVAEYTHAVGQSITGGYVYRGNALPGLRGYYVYGDFVTGKIFVLKSTDTSAGPIQIRDSDLSLASFGVDESNEIYLIDYGAGKIYRFSAGAL